MANCRKYPILLIALVLFASSCKKSTQRACLKTIGKEVKILKVVKDFRELSVKGDFLLYLIQDSLGYIEIKGGKNLVDFLSIKQVNSYLELNNENKCNFLRSFKDRVEVTLHFTNFRSLLFKGAGNINGINTLRFDTLEILNDNSSGSINLEIEANKVFSKIILGTADVNLRGKCLFSYAYNGSFGWISHKELKTSDAACFNNGSGLIEIYSDSLLNTQILGTGNVHAFGNPKVLITDIKGKGQLYFK